MWSTSTQARERTHDCLSRASLSRSSYWCGLTGVGGEPTEHGLPPTMLKPREPPSRSRTTVTLLASPSYRQTEETCWSERLGVLGEVKVRLGIREIQLNPLSSTGCILSSCALSETLKSSYRAGRSYVTVAMATEQKHAATAPSCQRRR